MRDFIKIFLKDKLKISPKEVDKKIKVVTVTSNPPSTDKQYLFSETFFDLEGNRTEFKSYKAGKIVEWEKFVYDKNNNLNEVLVGKTKWKGGSYQAKDFSFTSNPVANGDEHDKEDEGIVELNEKGQKVISIFYETGKLLRRKFFDENNQCIEMQECSTTGDVTYKEVYNAKGQLLEARRFRSDGTPLNYTINTYNDKYQLCRSISISRTGYPTYDTVLKYNEAGLLEETIEGATDPENAFADLQGASNGFGHRYFYTAENLLHVDNLYQCGKHVMSYRYNYQLW